MAEDSFLSLSLFFFFSLKKEYDTCHLKGVETLKLHTSFVSKTWKGLINIWHSKNISECIRVQSMRNIVSFD